MSSCFVCCTGSIVENKQEEAIADVPLTSFSVQIGTPNFKEKWISRGVTKNDTISVLESKDAQYWQLLKGEQDALWKFAVEVDGVNLFVSYDDSNDITLLEKGLKRSAFNIMVAPSGLTLFRVPKQNRFLRVNSGKLILYTLPAGETLTADFEWEVDVGPTVPDETTSFRRHGVKVLQVGTANMWGSVDVEENSPIAVKHYDLDQKWILNTETTADGTTYWTFCTIPSAVPELFASTVLEEDVVKYLKMETGPEESRAYIPTYNGPGVVMVPANDKSKYLDRDDREEWLCLNGVQRNVATWEVLDIHVGKDIFPYLPTSGDDSVQQNEGRK